MSKISQNPQWAAGPGAPTALDEKGLLRAIFAATRECIKVVAPDGRLLQMNAAGLRMIDAPSWEAVACAAVSDLIAPEHRSAWLESHKRVCLGESLTWEFDIIGLDGSRRHMETHGVPIGLDGGEIGQLAITRDVSEQRGSARALKHMNEDLEQKVGERTRELNEALTRLQASEHRFELLVNSVTDYALYMLDPTGQIVSWNSGAKRIKGYESAEIIGKNFRCFYTQEDREAGIPDRGLIIAAREGRMETEGWRLRKDGSRFWANVIIDSIQSGGKLVGFAKITRDISDRRAAEAKLRHAQKMEAIGRFTGGAAHDFNNLLMAILASLEILRKRVPDDKRILSLIDNAMQGAKRGASLTQRMLAFARRQELKHEPVDLGVLTDNLRPLVERSVGPLVSVEYRLPPSTPYVRTDADQLETALLNVVVNARDAMPNGGTIVISVRAHSIGADDPAHLPPGPYACLSVEDTGQGMDESTLARAAEPFFTTKGIGKGTGLGLSLVDGLVAQSGGKLIINSTVGKGTAVELWLPVVEESPTLQADEPAAGSVEAPASQRRLCIMVVDDDSLVLANIRAMLEDLGHGVIEAGCGARALELLDSSPRIELLISDQLMPGMTGLQLIEAASKRRPELPVILATGYAEFPDGVEPSIGRLSKPFSQRELAAAIASAVHAIVPPPHIQGA